MALDFEGRLEFVLRRTLILWLFPYIFWFFGRRIYRRVADWVTEPHFLHHEGKEGT